MCERPKRLRKCVKGELRAVEGECAQIMGSLFGALAKILVQFVTDKDESINASMRGLRVLLGQSDKAAKDISI